MINQNFLMEYSLVHWPRMFTLNKLFELKVLEDGRPWLDMAHVISCLNKFDAGVPDKICLMSRDEQNVLVVAYHDLKICLDQSYAECVQSAKALPTAGGSQPSAVNLGMANALSSTQYLG